MPRVGPAVVLVAALASALAACTAFEGTSEPASEGQPPEGTKALEGTRASLPHDGNAVAPGGSAAAPTSDVPSMKTDPEGVCSDYLEVLGKAATRCHDAPDALFALLGEAVTGPDCWSVTKVRDPKALYAACFPWVNGASCTDVGDAAKLPAACKDQFAE